MGEILDPAPIGVLFALFAVLSLVLYEVGYRIGRWYQRRTPGVQEAPTDMIVGALLALMAFLLAVTMGMASDRFDARRGLVVQEANAIEAAYLQADYLPDPAAGQLKELVREYLAMRIVTGDPAQVAANVAASAALRDRMWAIEGSAARSGYLTDLMSALGDTLTEVTNVSQSRVVSGLYTRVPPTILVLLLLGSVLSLGMVGYSAGLRETRSLLTAVVLIFALGAVLVLVMDLDRPQEGFINVSQQALLDVQQRIGLPSP